ncbi:MAG: hypothetical protein DMG65_11470 [Candidatus Angelobacter sp. Gp1-AA117]|nr:MAG: hypothetical protein DMG65_11470 [Candidatus Angelobacter sp. Gp1-AA117]
MDQIGTNFLKDRLRQQAQAEGVSLTSDEEMFIDLATSGRMQEANQVIQNIKQKESIQQFGQKLVTLLGNAYRQDLQTDPQAKDKYRAAVQSLAGGHGIFKFVLPLILERGAELQNAESDMVLGVPKSMSRPAPPITSTSNFPDPSPAGVPGVEPESSVKRFLMLLFLVIAAVVLWFIISRR